VPADAAIMHCRKSFKYFELGNLESSGNIKQCKLWHHIYFHIPWRKLKICMSLATCSCI